MVLSRSPEVTGGQPRRHREYEMTICNFMKKYLFVCNMIMIILYKIQLISEFANVTKEFRSGFRFVECVAFESFLEYR